MLVRPSPYERAIAHDSGRLPRAELISTLSPAQLKGRCLDGRSPKSRNVSRDQRRAGAIRATNSLPWLTASSNDLRALAGAIWDCHLQNYNMWMESDTHNGFGAAARDGEHRIRARCIVGVVSSVSPACPPSVCQPARGTRRLRVQTGRVCSARGSRHAQPRGRRNAAAKVDPAWTLHIVPGQLYGFDSPRCSFRVPAYISRLSPRWSPSPRNTPAHCPSSLDTVQQQ